MEEPPWREKQEPPWRETEKEDLETAVEARMSEFSRFWGCRTVGLALNILGLGC